AIRLTQLEQEISRIRRKEDGQLRFADLVGFDGGLSPMVKIGLKAAQTDVPVLLGGETGVGKEVFARAIHGESKRAGRPFVAVNCGAIPKNLAESVLFGHEKGAFTGAVSKQIGKFREAEGGTIFLDEVGELPLDLQVKLLRALQQREIEPVGLGRAVAVNVRIISATNRDLAEEVRTGRFREDLFFRLDVLPIRLLPLRERRQDILPLAKYFLQHYAACDDLPLSQLSRAAEERLLAGYWPGNVRELENVIRRAMVMAEAEVIEADMLALSLPPAGEEAGSYEGQVFSVIPDNAIEWIQSNGAIRTMEQLEAEAIHRVLEHCKGNVTQAAKALGIAKSTFYKKLKRLEQEAV
ncbi:MAG: sigma-54 interaction domain-containing protein, partial [Rickettsiales bacterium]